MNFNYFKPSHVWMSCIALALDLKQQLKEKKRKEKKRKEKKRKERKEE